MQILTATPAHIEDVLDLFDAYRVFYQKKSDKRAARQFLLERMERKESVIYIAKNEAGEYLGFTQLYPLFSSTRMQRMWLLNDLFVKPQARGLGVSKLLIEQAKELARTTNACGISLETGKDNMVGNQLYPRTDFELDTAHNYYFWTCA